MSRADLLDLLADQPRHERITTLRSLHNLSQTGLAKIAKVQRGTVSTWEAPEVESEGGRGHEPGKIARSRMGAYFNVPSYVFTDEWGNDGVAKKRDRKRDRKVPKKVSNAELTVPASPVKRIG